MGRGVAWVEQDYLRRILLREHDRPGAPNVGLIDQTVRYALDAGYHVIADHAGPTGVYYFQLPFEKTVERHATRPLSKVVTPEQMRDWYQPCDLLDVPGEQIIDVTSTLDDSANRIITDLGWTSGGAISHPVED
jgi:hypothetical protein